MNSGEFNEFFGDDSISSQFKVTDSQSIGGSSEGERFENNLLRMKNIKRRPALVAEFSESSDSSDLSTDSNPEGLSSEDFET